jgi:hypothetical protein
MTLGSGSKTLSLSKNFAAIVVPMHGVDICRLADNQWTHLDLSSDPGQNTATTVIVDHYNPNHLWIGSVGQITIVDMPTGKILGECKEMPRGPIELIVTYRNDIFFMGAEQGPGSYILYHMGRPPL